MSLRRRILNSEKWELDFVDRTGSDGRCFRDLIDRTESIVILA